MNQDSFLSLVTLNIERDVSNIVNSNNILEIY